MVHGTRYFEWNYYTQRYKSIGGTQNITLHLKKNHNWDGLTTIQLKKKQRIWKLKMCLLDLGFWIIGKDQLEKNKILRNSVQKDAMDFFYLQYTVFIDKCFSQVEHFDFLILFQCVYPATNFLWFNSHNTVHSWIIDLLFEGQECFAIVPQSALSSIQSTFDA